MAGRIMIKAVKAAKGERITSGSGWRLATPKGKKRVFVGALLQTLNFRNRRFAIFSVPKKLKPRTTLIFGRLRDET
jgi:hypothetical protein